MNKPIQMEMALAARDRAMDLIERKAGREFSDAAAAHIVHFLSLHKEAKGEDITDAVKEAGCIPHDDRAFGPVFLRLLRSGAIESVGYVARRKGHGAPGGQVWRLK